MDTRDNDHLDDQDVEIISLDAIDEEQVQIDTSPKTHLLHTPAPLIQLFHYVAAVFYRKVALLVSCNRCLLCKLLFIGIGHW